MRYPLILGFLALLFPAGCGTAPERAIAPSPVADEHHRRGESARARGADEEAREAWREAVRREPLFVDPHRRLQNLRMAEHDRERLLEEYTALRDRYPRSGEAAYLRGRLLRDPRRQEQAFREAIRLTPTLPWAHYGLAWSLYGAGRRDEARGPLRQALVLDPDHVLARLLQARILAAEGKTAAARTQVDRVIDLDPREITSWILRAELAQRSNDPLGELEAVRSGLEVDPTNARLLDRLRRRARGTGDRARLARDVLEDAWRRDPDDGALAMLMAEIRDRERDPERAAVAAAAAVRAGPVSYEAVMILRRSLVEVGRPHAAVRAWAEAIDLPITSLAAPVRRLEAVARRIENVESPSFEMRLELLGALDAAGWHVEAWELLRRLDVTAEARACVDERWLELRRGVTEHRRVLDTVSVTLRHRRPKPSDTLTSLLDSLREAVSEVTGVELAPDRDRILQFPFVGELLDVSAAPAGSLTAYFRAHNQVLLAGRLQGEAPQIWLASSATDMRTVRPEGWSSPWDVWEVIGDNVTLRPQERGSAEVGGRALFNFYVLDLDVIVPWRAGLERVRSLAPEIKRRLLASRGFEATTPRARRALDRPLDVDVALLLRACEMHGSLPVFENVRVHEIGHLLDSQRYIPLWPNIFSNLFIALQGGFHSEGVMSYLEEQAQLHALRAGPSPHLALSELVRALPGRPGSGPHAVGYRRLLERFLDVMEERLDDLAHVRADRVLLHQLHHLTEEEIRSIAREL